MEVVSARLSQCNQLPYMEVKVVVHCKDSAKSCSIDVERLVLLPTKAVVFKAELGGEGGILSSWYTNITHLLVQKKNCNKGKHIICLRISDHAGGLRSIDTSVYQLTKLEFNVNKRWTWLLFCGRQTEVVVSKGARLENKQGNRVEVHVGSPVLLPSVYTKAECGRELRRYTISLIYKYTLTVWVKGNCNKWNCIICLWTSDHEGVLWSRSSSEPIDMVGIRQEQELDTTNYRRRLIDS